VQKKVFVGMLKTLAMKGTVVCLLLITAVGGILRFASLEKACMGADVMEFYKIAQTGVSPLALIKNSEEYLGRMPPLWFAVHNGFLQLTKLPVTFTTIRLPDACAGVLTIVAAFLVGQIIKGNCAGLLAALFIALHPLHIQMSRECYFYAPIVLGCFLGLWSVLRIQRDVATRQSVSYGSFMGFALSFLLLTHIQISSWIYAMVITAAAFLIVIRGAQQERIPWTAVHILTVCCLIVGTPTLPGPWGVPDAFSLMFGEAHNQWSPVFDSAKTQSSMAAWGILRAFLFGTGGIRTTIGLCMLFGGTYGIARHWKHCPAIRLFSYISLCSIVLLTIAHTLSIFPPTQRHYSSIIPAFTILFVVAIMQVTDAWMANRQPTSSLGRAAVALTGGFLLTIICFGYPAYLVTQMIGRPPYASIAKWADANLPKGTLILCDRWLAPWNEFRVNPATNVMFTYTVPNEPIAVYRQNNWRETAITFMNRNPFSAFFERKEYWRELGPWQWPHQQFAKRKVFTDPAGDRLDEMGLHYRAVPGSQPVESNHVTLFYNAFNDVLERARRQGKKVVVQYASGWDYKKMPDHLDWRFFWHSADLHVYNLTDDSIDATLILIGTTVWQAQGNTEAVVKTIKTDSGLSCRFLPNQMQQQALGPITLKPGQNTVSLRSDGYPSSNTPLLINHIKVAEYASAANE
jgi:hypothetical protein